ncbi:MAG: ATP-binding protein [Pseudohongiella sp.]|nr:ATP-binding protein [Pseudohongiella sp.]
MFQQNIKRWFKSLLLLPAEENASLLLWRTSILRMLMLATLISGVVTMVLMALFPLPNRNLILAVDAIALSALSFVTFYRPLSYTRRAQLSLLVFFVFWVWLFAEIGIVSLNYLLAIPLFAALLLGLRTAIMSVPVSMLALFVSGLVYFPDLIIADAAGLSSLQSWLIIVLNFGFTAAVITAASGLLISRMEAALLLSQKALRSQRQNEKLQAVGTLASGVAHDFNNILMIMVALSESLRERSPDKQTRDSLDQILLSAERGRDIVRQLLTFSRQAVPERRVLDLVALIHEMEPLLRAQAPAKVHFRISYIDNAVIVGSAAEIQQVMMNLVGNAVLAIKPKESGNVEVRLCKVPAGDPRLLSLPDLDASRDFVTITIRDDGTGIETRNLPRLFEPFFTTREPGQGTGLGLASCHGIITSLEGGINVESQVGQYSEFVVYLPLCAVAAASGATDEQSSTSQPEVRNELADPVKSPAQTSILLVDDEPMILQTSRGLLESAGYKVTSVKSAADAKQALEASAFDLLITDYSMPRENGMSLILYARNIYPALPVILTTGLGHVEETELELMAHAIMLNKPYKKADLLLAMKRLLTGAPGSA